MGLRRRLGKHKIEFEVTDAAKELPAERGWDPVYGARPGRRTVQRLLQDRLAMTALEGRFRDEDWTMVEVENGELKFARGSTADKETAAAAARRSNGSG